MRTDCTGQRGDGSRKDVIRNPATPHPMARHLQPVNRNRLRSSTMQRYEPLVNRPIFGARRRRADRADVRHAGGGPCRTACRGSCGDALRKRIRAACCSRSHDRAVFDRRRRRARRGPRHRRRAGRIGEARSPRISEAPFLGRIASPESPERGPDVTRPALRVSSPVESSRVHGARDRPRMDVISVRDTARFGAGGCANPAGIRTAPSPFVAPRLRSRRDSQGSSLAH